jgi:drug/metabolite transporter (DMT)-like permease
VTHFGVAIALVATTVYNVGFVLEKRALTYLPVIDAHRVLSLLRTLFTAPGWLAGFALILGGMVLQLVVLSLEPLTVAQPLQASGVVVTILLSRLVLRERLGRTELVCIGVLVVSVVLLSLSSGHGSAAGTSADGLGVTLAALPGFLISLLIYWSAHRASRARHRYRRGVTGVSYGLCAGLMYGVAGLALKALSASLFSGHRTHSLLVAAALSPYLYVAFGCLGAGLVLFQTALQRSPASIVVPLGAIISTGYLIVIGSWLFHERLPGSPVLLSMRLVGGIAAVFVPVVLTVTAERAATRRRPATGGGPAGPPPSPHRKASCHEPGSTAAGPAGLPDRQAGAAVSGRRGSAVQPTAAPPLPRPR